MKSITKLPVAAEIKELKTALVAAEKTIKANQLIFNKCDKERKRLRTALEKIEKMVILAYAEQLSPAEAVRRALIK